MANPYEVYELHVRVIEARGLKCVQSMGMMDPFVLCRVGSVEKSSPVVTDGHVSPYFNFKTMLNGNLAERLELVIINKGGAISSNKVIGKVTAPYANFAHGRVEDMWLPVDTGGELHVRMQLMRQGEKPIESKEVAGAGAPSGLAPAPAPVPAPLPAPLPAPVPAPAPAPAVSTGPSQAELAALGRSMLATGMGGGAPPSYPAPTMPGGYPGAGAPGYPPATGYSPVGGYTAPGGYPPAGMPAGMPGYGMPSYPAGSPSYPAPGYPGTPAAGYPSPGYPGAYPPGYGVPPAGTPSYPGMPPAGYPAGVPPPMGYTTSPYGAPGYPGSGYPSFPR